ncbi:MAG: phosphatidate cytidylyltransferase [Bacteroidetes bacterium]|nr:phosphatidate cytidylyltransferase [Bacteroidota bacterium]
MALNAATLKTRSLTAVVFVIVMLAGLLWNFTAFFILFSIIHFGCWFEYFKLVEKIHAVTVNTFTKLVIAISGYMLLLVFGINHIEWRYLFSINNFTINLKILLWVFECILLLAFLISNKTIRQKARLAFMGGLVYITLPLMLLLNLRDNILLTNEYFTDLDLGKVYACTIIFSIWINDTMAYIVGSLIGKTPFSKISPKKTWEGTIGGALLCVVVISLLAYFTKLLPLRDAAIIAALCAIFGTIGDLFESKLKRLAGVKDSGSIMPGHGGFLDRFDSLLFAAPMVWLYVKLALHTV